VFICDKDIKGNNTKKEIQNDFIKILLR
jgi:hypothetical protein